MITNKSTAIRLGKTKNWSIQTASIGDLYSSFPTEFKTFSETFFSDSAFRSRGIAFSHVKIDYSRNFTHIQSFLQDAKLSDLLSTFPHRSIFSSRYKKNFRYLRRRRKPLNLSAFVIKNKFYFKKRFLFLKSRKYTFKSSVLLKKFFYSFYYIKFSRIRRSKRFFRFKQTYFTGFYNYFYGFKNYRLSYYFFIARILSKFFFYFSKIPLYVSFNHILPRHGTSHFYLNYICTKLYYRYILTDVVNPIVRISPRQWRGFSINCKGRFTRAQMAIQKRYRRGSLSFSYIRNYLDYSQRAVTLKYGTCNLKIWIRR